MSSVLLKLRVLSDLRTLHCQVLFESLTLAHPETPRMTDCTSPRAPGTGLGCAAFCPEPTHLPRHSPNAAGTLSVLLATSPRGLNRLPAAREEETLLDRYNNINTVFKRMQLAHSQQEHHLSGCKSGPLALCLGNGPKISSHLIDKDFLRVKSG